MSRKRMRGRGGPTRAAAVVCAASLAAFSPLTAAAQVTSSPDNSWAPPPASGSTPPDPKQPDKNYEKKTECVKRADTAKGTITIQDRPWGQDYLQINEAQKLVQANTGGAGKGLKVAVIDTGVTKHPWLTVEGGGDYVNAANNGLEDCDGHGTEVAGIIAAHPPADRIGFQGVAPDATIVSIRQSSQNYQPPDSQGGAKNGNRQQGDGAGNLGTLAQAVMNAANQGVSVMNISIDSCRPAGPPITTQEKQLQNAIHYAVAVKDIVVVVAAGNIPSGDTGGTCGQNDQADPSKPKFIVTPPWFADDVLSVAAIQQDGSVAPFSVNGPWVSVAAPGTEITSLDPSPSDTPQLANQVIEGGKPGPIQGTSFASPYVAGVATLVRAQFPNLNAYQVMKRIEATAQHPGAPDGHDQFIGYGVVDPVAALTAIVPSEEGIGTPPPQHLGSGLPPAANKDWTPMIVALAGTGGGLVVLLVTIFVMHTIRRNRPA
ncbi:type VII secretion-associated serine protease mycosin [Amycolatopsis taiwanensis]|uniref:type VII secretion-associated serine protease mycosin n=1 Tax=Amycolatopsis taiwanensis TaxID=342230 RepID=UPI001FE1DBCD|nr:type VII secretion-associated serine protease mycosin [Amycolatopsis taiwanensis]